MIDLTEDEMNMIAYALRELASRRQEQSLDYRYNTIAKRANQDEARQLRRLADKINNAKQNR